MNDRLRAATDGRWEEILAALCGLPPSVFDGSHQPCPARCEPGAGGDDRFRWQGGPDGSCYCSKCGGKDGAGGGMTGITLLMRLKGLDDKDGYRQACELVEQHLGLPSANGSRRRPVEVPPPQQAPRIARLPEPVDLPHPYRYSDTQRVTRVERPGQKKRFQVNHFADGRWQVGMGPDPWPILGRDLIHAQRDWVVEIEGEKCTGILLAAGLAAFTHPGHAHKLSQIQDRYAAMKRAGVPGIILISDNDTEGERRARISKKAAAKVGMPLIHVPAVAAWGDLPQGGSVDDVVAAGATIDQALEQLQAAAARAWEASQRPEPKPEKQKPAVLRDAPFRVLGQDGDSFVYQALDSGQLVILPRSRHTAVNLVSLAPIGWWETRYPSQSRSGGVNWIAAASAMFDLQRKRPPFDPRRLRGRGAWRDGDHVVFHLGDRLDVDGRTVKVSEFDGDYLYDRRAPLPPLPSEPLDDATGQRIFTWFKAAGWGGPLDHLYVAGQVILGPVGNVLDVRPQLVSTGRRGLAKTEAHLEPTRDLWGGEGFCLFAEAWSAAAVRQALRGDVLPVVLDEWENAAGDLQGRKQWGELLRTAYDGGETARGTSAQQAIRQLVSSCFLLAGINTEGLDAASQSRRMVVRKAPLSRAAIARQELAARDLITPENGRRLVRRTLTHLPTLLHNITVLKRAIEQLDGRRAQVYSHLLAGALLLASTERLDTTAEARAWLEKIGWKPDEEIEEDLRPDSEGRQCLDHLLAFSVRWDDLGSRSREITVRELIDLAAQDEEGKGDAVQALGRLGLKASGGGLYVAKGVNTSIFRGTTWTDGNHLPRLRDLPGTQSTVVWITTRGTKRTVWIPGTVIEGMARTEPIQWETAA